MPYKAIIFKHGDGFSARVPDLPGCVAEGRSFEETRTLIAQAVDFRIEELRLLREPIPAPSRVELVETP